MERVDVLLQLAKAAWDEMDKRREYEWRVNLALWPALAILAGFVLRGEFVPDAAAKWTVIAGLVSIAIVYVYPWSVGLHNRNSTNRRAAAVYWHLAEQCIGSDTDYHKPTKKKSLLLDWARVTQVVITLILVVITVVALFRAQPKKVEPASVSVPITVIDCSTGTASQPTNTMKKNAPAGSVPMLRGRSQ
jgi:hypothetical protein